MLMLDIKEFPNIGVIYLRGNFVMTEIDDFNSKIASLKENFSDLGISFKNVALMDSAALGYLIQLYRYLKEQKGGHLYLFGIEGQIKEMFSNSQLENVFNIIPEEEFKRKFIGYEYKMDFKVHTPSLENIDITNCEAAKVSLDYLEKVRKNINTKTKTLFYFEEDTNIYKRGKKILDNDIKQLKNRGYENIWVSSIQHEAIEDTEDKIIRETRQELENILADLYTVFNEEELKKGSRGVLTYFHGKDLLKTQLDPLQREGAKRFYSKLFGDYNKLSILKNLLERIASLRVTKVSIFSSRSIGSLSYKNDLPHMSKKMDEITYRIINHSVACAIAFITTCNRIFGQRALKGHQVSIQRLEKGEKRYDKNKRSQFQRDLIINAGFGILFHDIGYNHQKLRELLNKELKVCQNPDGSYIKDGNKRLFEEERALLKRHVNIAFNIMASNPEAFHASAIADNITKFHHCYLDGNGYPDRGSYIENKKVRFKIPIHELARLFSIINFYDSLSYRKAYRLPLRRETLVKYILDNSVPNTDIQGNPDEEGIWDIDTTYKQTGLFDGYLVKEFFKSIDVYKLGESVILKNDKLNKVLEAAIEQNNMILPHKPIIRVYMNKKWVKIDLTEETYKDWYIDELYETVSLHS